MKEKRTEDNKRVILITGDSTKWYEQAIFIVKNNAAKKDIPVDFVKEAERIINGYTSVTSGYDKMNSAVLASGKACAKPVQTIAAVKRKRNTQFDFTLNLMLLMTCVAIATVLAYHIL